jgi:hypothetical protein
MNACCDKRALLLVRVDAQHLQWLTLELEKMLHGRGKATVVERGRIARIADSEIPSCRHCEGPMKLDVCCSSAKINLSELSDGELRSMIAGNTIYRGFCHGLFHDHRRSRHRVNFQCADCKKPLTIDDQ